jgi:hypothetical protein
MCLTPSYHDDNSYVTVVTQSDIQDIFWIHQAAREIKKVRSPAYMVPRGNDNSRYYVVIALSKAFLDRFDAAWRRLTKDGQVKISFHDEHEGGEPADASNW